MAPSPIFPPRAYYSRSTTKAEISKGATREASSFKSLPVNCRQGPLKQTQFIPSRSVRARNNPRDRVGSLEKRLRLKWQLDRLVERRKDTLLRLTGGWRREMGGVARTGRARGAKEKAGGRRRRRERTGSGLAGGNNRLRGFESSPTSSRKPVSSARNGEGGKRNAAGESGESVGRPGRGGASERASERGGWVHGDDFTRRGTNAGLHGSRWPCR